MRVLIDYPYQRAEMLYESMDGEIWFGCQGDREYGRIWSTGHQQRPGDEGTDLLLVLEPPAVQKHTYERWYLEQYAGVLAFHGPDLEHVLRFRHPLPLGWPALPVEVNRNPWDDRIDGVVAVMGNKFSDHKSSLYAKRVQVLDKLHEAGVRVDCWGRPGFDDKPWFRGELIGDAEMKRRKLSQYRYCVCLENSRCQNYVTEKLPEAILAGCIPIYEGCTNLSDYEGFPEQYILSPKKALAGLTATADHHARYLETIDPAAIREAMSCQPLFQQILSLSI